MTCNNPHPCDAEYELCPGWAVIDTGGGKLEVQRCDTCQRFDSDDDARAHLQSCQAYRIIRQYEAPALHGQPWPDEPQPTEASSTPE